MKQEPTNQDGRSGFETLACTVGHTLKDPITQQPMHSAIGPTPEAMQIYLGPLKLAERLARPGAPLVLWDVGMGIAGNAAAALALKPAARTLEIHSFENELQGLKTALELIENFSHLVPIEANCRELLATRQAQVGPHRWILHPGSFLDRIKDAPPAEAIFYDFYSPRVCGELWSVPVMEAIRRQSPQAALSTYSAATPVRLALLLSGWWVARPGAGSPVTALKNESTVAWADRSAVEVEARLLGSEWLEKFRSSTQARPYPAGDPWSEAPFEAIERRLLEHPQFKS
jgi:hypothetical protein